MAAPLYANQRYAFQSEFSQSFPPDPDSLYSRPNSISVRQIIGKVPLAMINVLTRAEARNLHNHANELHGAWVIRPIDRTKSIVVHSYSGSDFNTAAAVAKLSITTDILPFVEYNLPESLKRLAFSIGVIVLGTTCIVLAGAISYKLTSCAFDRSFDVPTSSLTTRRRRLYGHWLSTRQPRCSLRQ